MIKVCEQYYQNFDQCSDSEEVPKKKKKLSSSTATQKLYPPPQQNPPPSQYYQPQQHYYPQMAPFNFQQNFGLQQQHFGNPHQFYPLPIVQQQQKSNNQSHHDDQNHEPQIVSVESEADLNKKIIAASEKCCSETNYAVQLLLVYFAPHELQAENVNVYGRGSRGSNDNKTSLDADKIKKIKQLVMNRMNGTQEEKTKGWSKCVSAMNKKLIQLRTNKSRVVAVDSD
jgi:hypothetical protein